MELSDNNEAEYIEIRDNDGDTGASEHDSEYERSYVQVVIEGEGEKGITNHENSKKPNILKKNVPDEIDVIKEENDLIVSKDGKFTIVSDFTVVIYIE